MFIYQFVKLVIYPQSFVHRLQHVLKLWSIFFPFNGCLVSRGAFGFVFVWVLVLSFTHAVCEIMFLLVLVFSPRVRRISPLLIIRSGILFL